MKKSNRVVFSFHPVPRSNGSSSSEKTKFTGPQKVLCLLKNQFTLCRLFFVRINDKNTKVPITARQTAMIENITDNSLLGEPKKRDY